MFETDLALWICFCPCENECFLFLMGSYHIFILFIHRDLQMMNIFLVNRINNTYYVGCVIQPVCIEERFPKEYIYIYYIIPKLAVLFFQIIL